MKKKRYRIEKEVLGGGCGSIRYERVIELDGDAEPPEGAIPVEDVEPYEWRQYHPHMHGHAS